MSRAPHGMRAGGVALWTAAIAVVLASVFAASASAASSDVSAVVTAFDEPWAQASQRPTGPGNCPPLTTSANGRDPRGVSPSAPNPLAGLDFFVDAREQAAVDYRSYKARGKTREAGWLEKLALAPKFKWFGRFNPFSHITHFLGHAQCLQPGSVPLMATLRHQGKQCNSRYTAGGVAEDNATKAWFRQFAETIGNARVVIGYEVDSVGTIECLARSRRNARREVLAYGVDVLSKLPNATVYLEATAPDWKSVSFVARELKAMGVAKVRGFMINATHYEWTSTNIRYGNRISAALGGKHFIINTANNGRGPIHYKSGRRRINVYCNPQYRGIGPKPTTNTGQARVDAFMYINRPGLSGAGACNGAPAKQGTWWPARALMFGRWGTEQLGPQKGQRFGLPFRVSLCRLGAPVRPPNTYSKRSPTRRCRR